MGVDAVSGMGAGFFSVLLNNPIDVVKSNIQGLNSKQYKGTLDCFRQIYATDGLRGYYRGVVPRLFRVTFLVGFTFTFYETVKRFILQNF